MDASQLADVSDVTLAALNNREVARLFDAASERYETCSNAYTLRRRAETLAKFAVGRCIELGGGTGAVTAAAADRSRFLHSDIALGMCRVARARLGCPSVCFDGEAIPLADESFDTAISSEMIYYLAHPERFVSEAHRILRRGGRLVLSTTNSTMRFLDRGRAWLRRLGFPGMFFDDGSPTFPSFRRIAEMLHGAGFTLESRQTIVPLPFAFMDSANRLLERTSLVRWGLFMIVAARK